MNENDPLDSTDADRSRVVAVCSTASVVLLCVTVLLVSGLFLTAAWLQHGSHLVPGYLPPGQTAPGQLPTAAAALAWLTLPPVGIGLAIPGMRPPRARKPLIGLIGNAVVWGAFPVSLILTTLSFGP